MAVGGWHPDERLRGSGDHRAVALEVPSLLKYAELVSEAECCPQIMFYHDLAFCHDSSETTDGDIAMAEETSATPRPLDS